MQFCLILLYHKNESFFKHGADVFLEKLFVENVDKIKKAFYTTL